MATSEEFKHHVVQLDGHIDLPPLRFPHTFEKHLSTSPSELPPRLASATIAIGTAVHITKANFLSAPKLQLLSCLGAGCDRFDLQAAKECGVTVTNTPAQNTSTVAEHALSLYFAVKRRIVGLDEFTKEGEGWKRQGMCVGEFRGVMPRVCDEEVVGIIGYGALGMCLFYIVFPTELFANESGWGSRKMQTQRDLSNNSILSNANIHFLPQANAWRRCARLWR